MHTCPLCGFSTDSRYEMFRHLGSTKYPRPAGHGHNVPQTIANALGFDYSGGYKDVEGQFEIGGVEVDIWPATISAVPEANEFGYRTHRSKSAVHRIYMTCPRCYRSIPAGRVHQHRHAGSDDMPSMKELKRGLMERAGQDLERTRPKTRSQRRRGG